MFPAWVIRSAKVFFVCSVGFFVAIRIIRLLCLRADIDGSSLYEKGIFFDNKMREQNITFGGDDLYDLLLVEEINSSLKSTPGQNSPDSNILPIKTQTLGTDSKMTVQKENAFAYDFVITHQEKCKSGENDNDVFLLVMVVSKADNFALRNMIRDTWAKVTKVYNYNIVTMFVLAESDNSAISDQLMNEAELYDDVILTDLVDHYRKLTMKTLMALRWTIEFCPQALFVMKTDDNSLVHLQNIVKYLLAAKRKNFIAGYIMLNNAANRDANSKWYMPKELFAEYYYPPYPNGPGYVMSNDVTRQIYDVSFSIPYLPLEDVYVGVCLRKLGISPVMNGKFHHGGVLDSYRTYNEIMIKHPITVNQMHALWKYLQKLNKKPPR
ncbi:beta-1,3-galactosyltransferase 1-like [Glandiceps talaboti]